MPLRLGVIDDPDFQLGDGLECDAAFIEDVIWLHERVFDGPDWEARAGWLLRHEILHAKIAVANIATGTWLGKRRFKILEAAAHDALRLAHSTPSLYELSVLLTTYEKSGLDEAEEALVRYIQLLQAKETVPITPTLLKAKQFLSRPWGRSPLCLLRTIVWLPVCGRTARLR
ncbi:hypothetical protein LY39_03403 [Roseinatronobacter bogoriensis subsp. barguzinensis]|uniref:Uncharacterized protein n=2 Tax=Roseinatronobacter bogoriensis TaxID=119542 RepID=A0A2K8K6Z4_9RHOB|nr:hypothetical protein BG454_04750 [Rhodobaca barguzinensis]TDW34348.1 hypothetical protein LY39_03403 [Rhodobaca barguzinensis]TDY67061.1 hypothetical protein EV660_10862 [Rhodobaca bogoriensis DSM 18756]